METEKFSYDNRIVKNFAFATALWGIVGMTVGVLIASQLFDPIFNMNSEYTSFGRIRPLHTNAVIFAFVGNAIFMGVYYSLQRLCKTRMYSDTLSKIHFWGWQLIIVAAAITLPLGLSTSHEYAELEWPIDIAITLIWVVFGINMFGTIIKRRERHLYVAIWFYIATFVTVAVLHLVNSFELPISFMKSYYWYAGVQDALVQWWYGHNAVAFFLTTPFLGLMYYYLPKMANRPIYSYKLSILHFWALIFLYIWAGPHHLLYTALPDWAQSLGVAFSIMLIAPSWGGMLNGLLTLRGAWDKVREDAILKFMLVGITCYGMATFEGPMLSLKSVNGIAHFTDWIVAHVHVGALGWNGFLTFSIIYWIIPRIYNTKIYSKKLINTHFWIGTLGILFYAIPIYWAGFTQGSMWAEFEPDGRLANGEFLSTVTAIIPFYMIRAFSGLLYLSGVFVMVYNIRKTIKQGSLVADEAAEAPALAKIPEAELAKKDHHWHRPIERKPMKLLVFSLIVILIGGLVEMVPTFLVESNIKTIEAVKPYTPLELQGRDIYIREGCVSCHSQMVRPFRSETERYGDYSKAGEFVYDHPFLWGSKRTGPDLAREGSDKLRKSNQWHFDHLVNPQAISRGSIMPKYFWLAQDMLDISNTADKINAMRTLGVPYEEGFEDIANESLMAQAKVIADELNQAGVSRPEKVKGEETTPSMIPLTGEEEIIALIAYLQRLGRDATTTQPIVTK